MKLFNTLTRSNDELTPNNDNKISMYACGLTVYSQPHIGNWVAYIYWDVLARTLREDGYDVTHVQNVTDVGHLTDDGDAGEDKMQKGALREGKTAWDVAKKYSEIAEHEAYDLLGLCRPNHMPRATDYIEQQIAYVRRLEEAGYTYVIADGVYFDTTKYADYGKLARLDIDGLQFGARVADTGKKHPTDFALWKFSPTEEIRDMEWDSPWGKGFPGWHLECSVMAMELLGEQIDIHAGGIDHIPVHHTNEIAQTEALTKKPFARTWVHANHLKVDGTKMSKSLGNIYTLDDIAKKGFDLKAFKLLVLSKHYRTEGNFTWDILSTHASRLKNWQGTAVLRHQTHDTIDDDQDKTDSHGQLADAVNEIIACMTNDLDTPGALAAVDKAFNYIDSLPSTKLHHQSLLRLLEHIRDVLGIDLFTDTPDISDEQKQLILKRLQARDMKNWELSDKIRDELLQKGVALNDTPYGTIWQYA